MKIGSRIQISCEIKDTEKFNKLKPLQGISDIEMFRMLLTTFEQVQKNKEALKKEKSNVR